jgi:hypothetical protein
MDVATWVGDVGQAAAEWATVHPHPHGGTTRQNYMDFFAPEFDLIADIDGVAMTSSTTTSGFAFDANRLLSENLERFYFPAVARQGQNRRFHIFCATEGLALEPDGITLSPSSVATIDQRIRLFADWFSRNDPSILRWMAANAPSPLLGSQAPGPLAGPTYNPIWGQWVSRANDWQWFAQRFRDFLQRNLTAEGR